MYFENDQGADMKGWVTGLMYTCDNLCSVFDPLLCSPLEKKESLYVIHKATLK